MHETATVIVQKLQDNGFVAYFAGGCVRDMIVGQESNDIDIATNATPEEIQKFFPSSFPVGASFGVMMIVQDSHSFEVATFRKDSEKSDGRRPESVEFVTAEEDAFRRDFTVNGMFYDPITQKIIDFVGGQVDLQKKVLRFIGNPEDRIEEDFLRILRAVRFKNRMGFDFGLNTQKALKKRASGVLNITAERITDELHKIIQHYSRAHAFQDLWDLEILQHIIPETIEMRNTFQPEDHHSEGDVLTHTFTALHNVPEGESTELLWALFFHDMGKAFTKTFDGTRWRYPNHENVSVEKALRVMQQLKFPKKAREKICWLIRHEQLFDQFFEMKLATRFQYYDHPFFPEVLQLHKYDVLGSVPSGEENQKTKKKRLQMIHQIEENLEYAHANALLPSYKKELLSGTEIMQILQIDAGKAVGEIKEKLRIAQIEGAVENKEDAVGFIKGF